jgi:pimeloyl-ACP methyl ester carboxylesterase/catechol 2,3-dioxygenase-like lactoylglutathione lyase family enzyme
MLRIPAGNAELCAQTFGDPTDPAVLLIHGATSSMDWWEDEFCERIAVEGRYVIRYDHRDTGQSTCYPPGVPPYSFADLVSDAVAVLDGVGVDRAHVVGMSMGGGIAQRLAISHPDRVETLTLVATSPDPGAEDLPPMPAEAIAEFSSAPRPDWSDPGSVLAYLVNALRLCAARSVPFDEAGARGLAGVVLARSRSIESGTNHFGVRGAGPGRGDLARIAAPTLVIHGDEDPVHPLGHGQALAGEIGGAELLVLPHTGHELPRRSWDTVIPALLIHTRRSAPRRRESTMTGKPFSGFAVSDTSAAKAFYTDVLGLTVTGDDMLAIDLGDGHRILVYPKPDHQPAGFTILNLAVPDVGKAVAELAERGVEFLRYDGFGQDEDGVMRGNGPDIAWFTDPSGNVFSVVQE